MMPNLQSGTRFYKNFLTFLLPDIISKTLSFFIFPIYSYALTKEQYGTLDLFQTVYTLAVPLITLNIGEAILRFLLDKSNERRILQYALYSVIYFAAVSLSILPILYIFPDLKPFALLLFGYSVSNYTFSLCTSIIRGLNRLNLLAAVRILNQVASLSLVLLFLKALNWNISGYLLSSIIPCTIMAMALGIYIYLEYRRLEPVASDSFLDPLTPMLKYSVYLIPNSYVWWIMNLSDRLFIGYWIGASANGIYAMGCKIPSFFMSLSFAINQAWIHLVLADKSIDFMKRFSTALTSAFKAIALICSAICLIIKPFFGFYLSEAFFSAWRLVPILLLGSLFLTLSALLSSIYTFNKDSRQFFRTAVIGAIVNLIGNFVLIPQLGTTGAAISTSVSYSAVFFLRIANIRKTIPIQFFTLGNSLTFLLTLSISITCYIDIWWPLLLLQFCVLLGTLSKDIVFLSKSIAHAIKSKRNL